MAEVPAAVVAELVGESLTKDVAEAVMLGDYLVVWTTRSAMQSRMHASQGELMTLATTGSQMLR